jgi:hypothetical protein
MDMRSEVYVADELALAVAYRDIDLFWRILGGEEVPPGTDLDALMDRVDLWERQRLFEIADHEKGSWYWSGVLVVAVYDTWRRKVGEALSRGESWRAITTTGLSLQALGAMALLVIRKLCFPLAPIGLRPLRIVLAFTS